MSDPTFSAKKGSKIDLSQWLLAEVEKKIVPPEQLGAFAAAVRKARKSLVSLNGSFDLFHAGHLFILFEASRQADILIVALNSDESIKRYKSPDRPIIPLKERLELIGALECVDYVTWFDETDPREVLSLLRPDVHVNGAEYGENCIEAEVVKKAGGRLHLVQRIDGLSSSAIIRKIHELPL